MFKVCGIKRENQPRLIDLFETEFNKEDGKFDMVFTPDEYDKLQNALKECRKILATPGVLRNSDRVLGITRGGRRTRRN
jgi:hypothetical protein